MTSQSAQKSLRDPIGIARGLGAAGHGFEHWWAQRLSSIALVPLSLWFAFSMATMAGADYATVKTWLASPLNAALALLLTVIMYHHVILGVEVIMEDYIHTKSAKLISMITMKFAFIVMAAVCVVSILKVALGG
ncbi:MAG: succinate dehydrogenase, hydrophobic membrane anchor protein [Azospirillum sp.]|nr:succinate dehydrogenase, hydrophobic membrane anchor protein [Azospirillum sp.]